MTGSPFGNVLADIHRDDEAATIRRDNVRAIREWMEAHPGECGDCHVNPGLCDEHDLGIAVETTLGDCPECGQPLAKGEWGELMDHVGLTLGDFPHRDEDGEWGTLGTLKPVEPGEDDQPSRDAWFPERR